MKRTIAALTVGLLVSALCVSEAAAYGGGGFYGSGRHTGFSGDDHVGAGKLKFRLHQRALQRNEVYLGYYRSKSASAAPACHRPENIVPADQGVE